MLTAERRLKLEVLRAGNIDRTTSKLKFTELVDEYSSSVYKFCRSLTYSKEDAEDLFQETCLRTYEQLEKLSKSDNPQSFFFSTALYTWKSWKRKYARRKRLAPVETLSEATVSDIDLEDSILAPEEINMVRSLVDSLPDKLKIPTLLYYTLELSVSEIALIVKIPSGTVKSRLSKARQLVEKGMVSNYYEE